MSKFSPGNLVLVVNADNTYYSRNAVVEAVDEDGTYALSFSGFGIVIGFHEDELVSSWTF